MPLSFAMCITASCVLAAGIIWKRQAIALQAIEPVGCGKAILTAIMIPVVPRIANAAAAVVSSGCDKVRRWSLDFSQAIAFLRLRGGF